MDTKWHYLDKETIFLPFWLMGVLKTESTKKSFFTFRNDYLIAGSDVVEFLNYCIPRVYKKSAITSKLETFFEYFGSF